eukprot:CAMPEP_0119130978 /NCGR_PEP_ID=MMETSP1310-20130426/9125_1 /TAXON_ID=464262 /ORGANISM="Genus nov. species nov., Strain RCC2339" /LENGTH=33 /DNA_ID= /DNA_START= /DNA_END= /DNA_ORIENTATION=
MTAHTRNTSSVGCARAGQPRDRRRAAARRPAPP